MATTIFQILPYTTTHSIPVFLVALWTCACVRFYTRRKGEGRQKTAENFTTSSTAPLNTWGLVRVVCMYIYIHIRVVFVLCCCFAVVFQFGHRIAVGNDEMDRLSIPPLAHSYFIRSSRTDYWHLKEMIHCIELFINFFFIVF